MFSNVEESKQTMLRHSKYKGKSELTEEDINDINERYNVPDLFRGVDINSTNATSTKIVSIQTVQTKLYDNPYMQKLINEGYRPIGSLIPFQDLNDNLDRVKKNFLVTQYFLTMRYTKNPDTQPSDYFTVATAGGSRRRRRQTKKRVVKRRNHKTTRK
jgi:hypothetical protein